MKALHSQVVVAGHICLDIIPEFPAGVPVPEPGELVQVGPAIFSTGGAVPNTGLALHRLGVQTQLMGKIGDDAFGEIVLGLIKAQDPGLTDGIIIAEGEATSYTVVLSLPGVDRAFIHCPGANDTFCSQDLKLDAISGARLFHLGYPPLLAMMYANDGEDLAQALRLVKSKGITTSLDMVMVDKNSAPGRADWEKILQRTLPHVDLFLPSIDEILLLLGYPQGNSLWTDKKESAEVLKPAFLRDLADRMLTWGAGMVLFKLGEYGAYLRTNKVARLSSLGSAAPADMERWANREIWSPIFRLDRFGGTTGAGDSASAGFVTALLKGDSPEEALMMACAVGACNVEEPDALSGLKTWEETVERIQQGWERLPREIHELQWHMHPATQTWLGPFDGKPMLNQS